MMKRIRLSAALTLALALSYVGVSAQQSLAVFSVYVNEAEITQESAKSMFTLEFSKTGKYSVLDKLDLIEVEKKSEKDFSSCFGRECLDEAIHLAEVDLGVVGSIESLGKKLVITVKIYDGQADQYIHTKSMEFIDNPAEMQRMIGILINSTLGLENDPDEMEMLVYYEEPPETPVSYIRNNGPRMGLAYIGGELGEIVQRPKNQGGNDAFPLMSQFGYQIEAAYLSAGNFQALVEGLFLVTGVEQNLFIPSVTFMNGFRSSKLGLEVGFGPSINFRKIGKGYYDDDNVWHLENEYVYEYDSLGEVSNPMTYDILERPDSRGDLKLTAAWVWALGKTFKSGYLNIPVNAYFSHSKYGWFAGLSVGFNIAKER